MRTTDKQVRKLMEEMTKLGEVGRAANRADMDRKTARKYIAAGKLPSEMEVERHWLTREDPFATDWPAITAQLEELPELEAKTIFDALVEKHPGRYQEGQLRTLQRHIKRWRAAEGPDKRVFFAQAHRPGEAAQTDFTSTRELGVTICGEVFAHLLCVFVLPYSNWEWATVCLSESLAALRRGVQAALFQLGRVPVHHQTDNSTAATHRVSRGATEVAVEGEESCRGRRRFNDEYLGIMRHFGMDPRTTGVGEKEQNGDVEARNGVLKRRLEQALLLRGSRDFESREAWELFVQTLQRKANLARGVRVAEELAVMRPLDVSKLPEFTELSVPVSEWCTIRVKNCSYSVPSRLIGETVCVRLYEDHLDVHYAGKSQHIFPRLRGDNRHCINYRHVIWSLVKKPGAFERYIYRDEMFPTVTFRRAYDAIHTPHQGVRGDLEYLRILHLAASTLEADVDTALALLLAEHVLPTSERIKALVATPTSIDVPALLPPVIDLTAYDDLLGEVGT
ncbi:MAG: transposase family protein [Gemmatimonadaceae bacterium]|nr:transposase family protein [Gemmatimonadaceae bacterium]